MKLRKLCTVALSALSLDVVAAIALPSTTNAQAAPADSTKAEARERFDRGLKLFNQGDNPGALGEFRRAYDLIPNTVVLYNIGLVYAAMNRPVEAVEALDRALADTGKLTGDRLSRARQTRDEEVQKVAEVEVTTNVPATVEVDTVQIGRTPADAPLRVASGPHIIGAVAEGYAPAHKEITVAGRTRTALHLDLVAIEGRPALPAPLAPAPSEAAPRPPGSGMGASGVVSAPIRREPVLTKQETTASTHLVTRTEEGSSRAARPTWGWITLAVGGALALSGATYYFVNAKAVSDAQNAFDSAKGDVDNRSGACRTASTSFNRATCEGNYYDTWDTRESARSRSTVALVGAGVGVAAAGVGAYFLFWNGGAQRKEHSAPATGLATWEMAPSFSWTAGMKSMALSGRF